MRELDQAIAACTRFLLRHQASDGSYSDWDLAPGPSDCWTTAYVAAQLPGAAQRGRAAQWLIDNESPGGGWSYNKQVGCDADSTAHALLLLPHMDDACLMAFRQADGGFSTYRADEGLGSWCRSHVDVSAVCGSAMLMRRGLDDAALQRAINFVANRRNADGLWDSFWWRSPLYATRSSLALLNAAKVEIDHGMTRRGLASVDAGNAFERALLLECLMHAGAGDIDSRIGVLLEEQLDDGSWASAPVLRLTSRACMEPWNCDDAGPLYADPRRLFTSATVLRALHAAQHRRAEKR